MHIGIVGGGINGLCCAWAIAQAGHQVTMFERDLIMQATSGASSKLLHGGIRYLETGQFRLVREALHERDEWLSIMPELASPLPIIYPKYQGSKRSLKSHSVILPKACQDFADIFFKSLNCSRLEFHQFILHLVPKLFNAIEFSTVSRQKIELQPLLSQDLQHRLNGFPFVK